MNHKTVVDASVAVKWFTKERGHTRAVALRQAHLEEKISLVAPDLLVYEVANALRYNKNLAISDIKEAVKALNLLGVRLYPPAKELLGKAIDLAAEYSITIYDASYLALTHELDAQLITADKKLAEKNPDRVIPLEKYQLRR